MLGTIMLILAFVVSCSRILSGVHYISDVLSAVIIALIISFL
ncbi:phosphatase PAP2 family protein [Mediterraneibacter gnavus]|uniref:Phosphatase PAP2 family protein n=1 Tax=Mediterraneibacter gnavus TaxID=33038 RepID=A0AAJ1B358_MEDGN|nr:phosphatase PAP2 family protein [Mediterraneibacter gnavus]